MASLLQLRRDTTSNWASTNPTLSQGELGIDLNLNRIKIGNGLTQWLNLPWMDVSKDQLDLSLLDLGIPDGVDGQVLATNGDGYFHFVDAVGEELQLTLDETAAAVAALQTALATAQTEIDSLQAAVTQTETGIANLQTDVGGLGAYTTSLGTAVNALQTAGFATEAYVDAAVGAIQGFSGDYADLTNKPDLSNFVTTGEDGAIVFPDGTTQLTAYVPPPEPESLPPYRGFYAVSSRYSGTDKAFYQVIIANTADQFAYGKRVLNTENDDFYAEGLATATSVSMFNLYANTSNDVMSVEAIKAVTESFIDSVLYDGETLVTDAAIAKQRFADNFSTFTSGVANELETNFQFGSSQVSNYQLTASTGGNVFINFGVDPEISTFNYIYFGHDNSQQTGTFTEGEIVVIPGDQLGGVTPDNDMTLTIMTDNGSYIGAVASGFGASPMPFYPTDSIDDGGTDQYDTGNYIRTDVSGNAIPYNRGNPVTSADQYWGAGSSYVATYNSGVFAMMAFNTAVDACEYGGGLGYDGSGGVEVSRLIGGSSAAEEINLGDFKFRNNILTTNAGENITITAGQDLYLDAKDDDIYLRAEDDIRIRPGYNFPDDSSNVEFRFTDGGELLYADGTNQSTAWPFTREATEIVYFNGNQGQILTKGGNNDLVWSDLPDLSTYATTSYVDTSVANLINSAPGALDTLNELAAALGNDVNFSSTVTNQLATIQSNITALQASSFSGNYDDLTNKPTIPSIVGLATEAYVNSAIAAGSSSTLVGLSDVSDSLITNIQTGQQLQWTGTEWTKAWTQILQTSDTSLNTNYGIVLKSPSATVAHAQMDGGDNFLYNPFTKTVTLEGQALTAAKIQSWDSIVTTAATQAYVDSAVASAGGAAVTVSATAPVSPSVGDLWYDETEARTFVWNGSAWIDAAPGASMTGVATESYVDTAIAAIPSPTTEPKILLFDVKASAAITKGQVIMFAGSQGDHILAAPADTASVGFKSEYIMGVATQNLAVGEFGTVMEFGKLTGLNTSAYAESDLLYVDPAVVGGLTNVMPAKPAASILVAAVIRQHATQGSINVRPTFSKALAESHNVSDVTPLEGDFLGWNESTQVWEPMSVPYPLPNPNYGSLLISGEGWRVSEVNNAEVGEIDGQQFVARNYYSHVTQVDNGNNILDFGYGVQTFTQSGPVTFTAQRFIPGYSQSLTLVITADGAPITWPTGTQWPNGTPPSFDPGTHIVTLVSVDGGTTFYGVALNNYS